MPAICSLMLRAGLARYVGRAASSGRIADATRRLKGSHRSQPHLDDWADDECEQDRSQAPRVCEAEAASHGQINHDTGSDYELQH